MVTVALVELFGYGTLESVALKPSFATASVKVAQSVAGRVSVPSIITPICVLFRM